MKAYADTNFFTRLYMSLPGSSEADEILGIARNGALLPITWLHQMEIINAFEMSVWMSRQGGQPRVSRESASIAQSNFAQDLADESFLCARSVDLSSLRPLFEQASAQYTAKHGIRTYDILHVVSARALGCDHIISFDMKANKLAQLEGLKLLAPPK